MAIYTKEFCKQRLGMWLDAEAAITTGQRYQIDGRSLTRADLYDVRKQIEFWEERLAVAEAEEKYGGRNRVFRTVIRDV